MKTVELLPASPAFCEGLHRQYITELSAKLDQSYEGAVTDHLRMSGVYWSLTALSLLDEPETVVEAMGVDEAFLGWILACFDPDSGGFGGHTGHDGHLLYTLSAVQLLALLGALDRVDRTAVVQFCAARQQADGSFTGDAWGEVDTRFTYCALQTLALLGALDAVDLALAASYVVQCRNLDGGFGCVIGAESHAGQVFCAVGALAIAQQWHLLTSAQVDHLCWWLCERQVDSGGLNGRPEKQADVCYSWWILSSLAILNRTGWIAGDRLARFILLCQDDADGGIADRPDDMPDVYHTFFGIAGLSLLGHLHQDGAYRKIDPLYALPTNVVQTLQLPGQVVTYGGAAVDERLSHYQVYDSKKESSSTTAR